MGLLGKTAKKGLKKIHSEYTKYKGKLREKVISLNASEDVPLLEALPSILSDTTETICKSSQPKKSYLSKPNLDAPSLSSSLDSGISETCLTKKPVKKIQFTTALVHEFNSDTVEQKPLKHSAKVQVTHLYKVKYFDVPTPQKVKIISTSSLENFDNSLHYSNPRDTVLTHTNYSVPYGTVNPPKPPRFPQNMKKTISRPPINNDLNNMATNVVENKAKHSPLKAPKGQTSCSSLDIDDIEKMLSLPKKPYRYKPTTFPEPMYAQIKTPRSSTHFEPIVPLKFSTPISSNHSTPQSRSETTSETILSNIEDSSDFHNGVLSKEIKEALNMIHKTDWTLRVDEILKEHDYQLEKKKPQDPSIDKKFVVNVFESRGSSKRLDKNARQAGVVNDQFQMNSVRMNLDSQMVKDNLGTISNTYDDIEESIQMLELEYKTLENETQEIKKELKRMLREGKAKCPLPPLEKTFVIDCKEEPLEHVLEGEAVQSNDCLNKEQFERYQKLKMTRDIECSRMAQASRALSEIKLKKGKENWLEVLVAERILLETSERVNLLTQEIRENTYTTIPEPSLHKGSLCLSSIKFPFAKQFQGNQNREKHFTEFFLMTISHGTKMFTSEFLTGEMDPLEFRNSYTFQDVAPDFEIKVKLFCLKLRTSHNHFWKIFACSGCCPTSKIIYEDLLTHEYQVKTVFKTSFSLCAETTITCSQINEAWTRLKTQPGVFNKLEGIIEHNFKCEYVDMMVSLSGFLDVGTLLGERYFWERKWCSLKGPNLLIYNDPQQEDFGKPIEQVNLKYCFGPIITKVNNCSKKRCFQLRTGRPNDVTEQHPKIPRATLKTKPNFALRKFYFSARDKEDYERWTLEVGKLLDSLRYFKKLVFEEEYDEWVR